jgi:hypothetical protein
MIMAFDSPLHTWLEAQAGVAQVQVPSTPDARRHVEVR